MKLGFSDIVLILIVFGVVLIVIRATPPAENAAPARARRPTAAELEEARSKEARSSRMRTLGVACVGVGLLILAGALKMIDLLFSWYAAAALIIIAGVVVLFFSARD